MSFTDQTNEQFRFTGWHMLACMLAFFGVIVAVNITMAVFASGTWTGLVVKNSYIASQGFNDRLQAARLQQEAGLQSRLAFEEGELRFRILDRKGSANFVKDATVWIGRPAFEQQDRTLRVSCTADGACSAPINLMPGDWSVRIEAQIQGSSYRRDARLYVGKDGSVQVD